MYRNVLELHMLMRWRGKQCNDLSRINKTIFDGIYGDHVKPKTRWTKTAEKIEILESEVLWWRLEERRKFLVWGFYDSISVEIITYICLIKVSWRTI